MLGSMVGNSVWVKAGEGVSVMGFVVEEGKNVPVGVQGIGWKGVGVGDALGAAVTYTNGRTGWACAETRFPHPVRRILARSRSRIRFLINYG
jgi:hypothetical protein